MSSQPGVEALAALRSLRDLHRQCATLLRTADEIADDLGWESWVGNQVLIQGSYSLQNPDQWQPDALFRHYHPKARRDLVLFVSLLLIPRERENLQHFSEPLLSTGWVRFAQPIQDQYLKPMWLARAAFWTPEARGAHYVPFGHPDRNLQTLLCRVAARPLWSVTDAEGLRAVLHGLAADLTAHDPPTNEPLEEST